MKVWKWMLALAWGRQSHLHTTSTQAVQFLEPRQGYLVGRWCKNGLEWTGQEVGVASKTRVWASLLMALHAQVTKSDGDMQASYALSLPPAPLLSLSSYPCPVPEHQARPNFSPHPAICPLDPILSTQKASTRLPQSP